ncbi:crcB2, partial [Symbiodinium sp. KB8]
ARTNDVRTERSSSATSSFTVRVHQNQIAEWIGTEPGRLPWETLLVNLTGCLLIGLAASRIEPGSDRWLFGVTGLLGGFTTFSAFSNETRALLDTDRVGTAVAYVAVTLAGGLLAVAAGRRVGA